MCMNRHELDNFLLFLDNAKQWCFSFQTAQVYFDESSNTLRHSLTRHARSGVIVRVAKGLYANPRSTSKPDYALESFVKYLRSGLITYLSLESRLSETGVISQVSTVLTLVTEGRSQIYETPFGTIEFVHTMRKLDINDSNLMFDTERQIYIASPNLALSDLKRCKRNLNLVDTTDLTELQTEWEQKSE